MKPGIFGAAFLLVSVSSPSAAVDFSGNLNLEHRQFFQSGLSGQDNEQTSLVFEPEWFAEWNEGDSTLTFQPFARIDSLDDDRTHGDIRELMYVHVFDDYEFHAGIGKVFWGVAESQHLIDVVNQSDLVESVDGEQKLGQPMAMLKAVKDWGTVDVFILPYFRELTFAGTEGRLRPLLPISDSARYESSAEESHVDFAARYSHYIGDWDFGFSWFQGTNRDPYLLVSGNQLVPYYAQMDQVSADIQKVSGSWLWKLEARYRDSRDNHAAVVGGFEYTFVGGFDSFWDIGVLAEYQYDSRGTESQSSSQNDLFVGTRLALNDAEGTEILFGIAQDLDHSSARSGRIEASARIDNNWKWRANAWWFNSDEPGDFLYFIRKDDFVEFALEYYF